MAKHRPTEYRFTFSGDPALAAGARQVGKKFLRLLMQSADWRGNKQRVQQRRMGDTVYTVTKTFDLWHLHIDVTGSDFTAACDSLGFLFSGGTYATGFVEYPDYTSVQSGETIDELQAGYNVWYGFTEARGEPVVLTWNYTDGKYIRRYAVSGEYIWFRGCPWIKPPANVLGLGIIDDVLVVVVSRKLYYVPWNGADPYGVFDESGVWQQDPDLWTQAAVDYIHYSAVYNASSDGVHWYGHYYNGGHPIIYEFDLEVVGTQPVMTRNEVTVENTADTVWSGSNNVTERTSGGDRTIGGFTVTDSSSYAYYTADFLPNPAYTGSNCTEEPRCLNVMKTGPVTIPKSIGFCWTPACNPAWGAPPKPGWRRWWYAGWDMDMSHGGIGNPDSLTECADSYTFTQWVIPEATSWYNTYTPTGHSVGIRDRNKANVEVELKFELESGSDSYTESGDYYLDESGEAEGRHWSGYISAASALASVGTNNGQALLSLEGPPCPTPVTPGLDGGWVSMFYNHPEAAVKPHWSWYAHSRRTVDSSNYETTTNNYTQNSWFCGALITIYQEDSSSTTRTRNVGEYEGTQESTVELTMGATETYFPPYSCQNCEGMGFAKSRAKCVSGAGMDYLGNTVTVSTTETGTRLRRMYMEADLKEECALMAETRCTLSNGACTTRLYWETPNGQLEVLPAIPGNFLNGGGAWGTTQLALTLFYPTSWLVGTKAYDEDALLDFEAKIVPRNDEVLLFARGTLFGVAFNKLFGLNTGAGSTIETAITPDPPSNMRPL